MMTVLMMKIQTLMKNLIESIKGKMLFAVTKKGMCIKFPLAKVREIGRVSRG